MLGGRREQKTILLARSASLHEALTAVWRSEINFWLPQIQAESVIWQPELVMPETKGPVAQAGIWEMMLASIWAWATATRPAKKKVDERMIYCSSIFLSRFGNEKGSVWITQKGMIFWWGRRKNLRSGMKEAKLCLARPFPFLFLFSLISIVVSFPLHTGDPSIR